MILCISVFSIVISPFSFLILLIWFFSLCFLINLANGLSTLSSQRTRFSFVNFCYSLLCFFFIYFCPNFYDFFPSTNPVVLHFFGWMASPTQWTWTWANSGRWWWTGKPGVLQSMGLQRVGGYLVTEWQQRHLIHPLPLHCRLENYLNSNPLLFFFFCFASLACGHLVMRLQWAECYICFVPTSQWITEMRLEDFPLTGCVSICHALGIQI